MASKEKRESEVVAPFSSFRFWFVRLRPVFGLSAFALFSVCPPSPCFRFVRLRPVFGLSAFALFSVCPPSPFGLRRMNSMEYRYCSVVIWYSFVYY
jgi:hypothetical protein